VVISKNCLALEVAGQVVAVTPVKGSYVWVTEGSSGKESNVLEALKMAAMQARREEDASYRVQRQVLTNW